MKAATPYLHLHSRKRTWTPVEVSAGQLLTGGEEVIQRALALRCLEIPVGDFISDAMKKDLPEIEGCKELLLSNVKDEENHDIALNFAAKAHGVDPRFEAEAERIKKAWIELDRHPVLKAVVLERSVFFVLLPIFRFLGDTGLRTTSADISRDEQIHVAANTLVCKEMGYNYSPSLDKLRKATIAWIYEPLGKYTGDKYLSKKFWQDQSDNLMYKGKTNGLSDTKKARMPAFFEHSNVNLPQYS